MDEQIGAGGVFHQIFGRPRIARNHHRAPGEIETVAERRIIAAGAALRTGRCMVDGEGGENEPIAQLDNPFADFPGDHAGALPAPIFPVFQIVGEGLDQVIDQIRRARRTPYAKRRLAPENGAGEKKIGDTGHMV